jgi:hypothetical protein
VFEKKAVRSIFRTYEVGSNRRWRNLHNEELLTLFFSLDIVRLIKFGRMRWTGRRHPWRGEKCMENFNEKTSREETTWGT